LQKCTAKVTVTQGDFNIRKGSCADIVRNVLDIQKAIFVMDRDYDGDEDHP